MSNESLFALSIVDLAKLLGVERLAVGSHVVEDTITLKIRGTVTVGEDYDQKLVAKADPWALLALALTKLNGVTVDALVREAVTTDLSDATIKDRADEAIQAIKEITWSPCKGKVTKKLVVSVV